MSEEEKIENIIPYAQNNRVHNDTQIERIASSIKDFGFNQPIVIDENNIVLVGHGRLEAAKKLKLKTVPILKKEGLTEAQKKAYRILDNKLQNDSTWDIDNIKLELDFLEQEGFDLKPWGLDEFLSIDSLDDLKNDENVLVEETYRIEIMCDSELKQKEIYDRLVEEGLQCRLLTL